VDPLGPSFVAVSVNRTASPIAAAGRSTDFVSAMSAEAPMAVDAVAVLSPGTASGVALSPSPCSRLDRASV
jgi:hypothetical protein